MHLFLDLEDTIITPITTSWWQCSLIHQERIRHFIHTHPIEQLHVFSFALHNAHELERFNQAVRPRLEHSLGMPFTLTPTIDDAILPVCAAAHQLHPQRVDFSDLVDFWGKQNAWRTFLAHAPCIQQLAQNKSTPLHCVLIDDLVESEHFALPKRNIQGHCIPIFDVPEHTS